MNSYNLDWKKINIKVDYVMCFFPEASWAKMDLTLLSKQEKGEMKVER